MTTLELARDIWKFVTGHGQRIVITCQSQADNAPLKTITGNIERMFSGLEQAGLSIPFGGRSAMLWTLPDRDCTLQIVEAGASEAAAQKKGRAGTYTRVHATEVAFYEHAHLTFNALLEGVPNLPDTEVVFESTPNGAGTWFHHLFSSAASGDSAYRAHFFPWFLDPDCATSLLPGEVVEPQNDRELELVDIHHVSPEQLKFYRQKVGDKGGQDRVDQEYASDPIRCFLTSGRKFFAGDNVDAMAGKMSSPVRVDGNLTVWREFQARDQIVIGVDTAEGLGEDGDSSDWSVATGWLRHPRVHAFTLRSKLQANPFADELVKVAAAFGNPMIAVERNKGMALIGALERIGYSNVYVDDAGKPGIATTVATRPVMLEEIRSAVEDGSLITHDPIGIAEMRAFVIRGSDGKPYAPGKGKKGGASDDWIMSTAMAWWVFMNVATGNRVHSGGERPDAAFRAGRGW